MQADVILNEPPTMRATPQGGGAYAPEFATYYLTLEPYTIHQKCVESI